MLLLDEPTNHLSVTLVDEFCDALLSTPAAVVSSLTTGRVPMVHDWPTVTLSPVPRAPGVRDGLLSSSVIVNQRSATSVPQPA